MLVVGWQFIGQECEWESTPLAKVLPQIPVGFIIMGEGPY